MPVAPWSRGAVETLDAALRGGGRDRLPADAEGDRGRRRARHPRGHRTRPSSPTPTSAPARRRARAFGSGVVFLERLVTGARHVEVQVIADGAGHRVGAGRPRLLGAAAQPEGHRGVRLAGAQPGADRRAEGVGRAARRRGRLPRRGTVEFLYHPGEQAVRVPRGQHPPAGRAPDHRDHHRLRPGQGAAARGRAAAGSKARRRSSAATPSRPGSTPRTPTATSRPPRAASRGWTLPAGPGHPGGHRRQRGRHHPGRLRLDDREDHRLRPRPRRGARPAAPGDGRDHGDHRGRRDQQELRARPARPARGDRRAAPTPAGSTASAPRAGSSRTGTPRSRWPPPRSRRTRTRRRVERQRLLSTAHGGRPQVQHESGRPLDLKLRGVGYRVRVARVGAHRFRVGIDGGGDVRTADVELERFDEHTGQIVVNGAPVPAASPTRTARSTWSRSTASRTGSAATRAASSARPRPRWSSRRRWQVGDEVEAGAPVLVLESMKMETVLRAPFRARLRECPVSVGSQVETGAPLLRLEPLADDDAEAEAAGRRGRRAGPARRAGGRVRGRSGSRAACRTCAACCSASTSTRTTSAGCSSDYLAARGRARGGPAAGRARSSCCSVFADLSELSRNRPARRGRRAGQPACTARASTSTPTCRASTSSGPALPEAFQAKLAKVLGHYGVDRPGAHARSWRTRSSGSSWPSSGRPPTSRSCRDAAARSGWPEPPPDEALRERAGLGAGAPGRRHPGPLPGGRRPGPRRGVPLVRPAAAAPQPRRGLRRRPRAPALPGRATRTRRTAPSGSPTMVRQRRAAGPAARPADRPARRRPRADAGGADPPLLRQPGADRRRAPREVAGCRSSSPSTTGSASVRWSPPPSTSPRCRDAAGAVAELRRRAERGLVADIYLTWADQPDADAMAARAAARSSPRTRCRAGVRRVTTTVAGTQRRGDAPPLHVPARRRRAGRGPADPRPAPADRRSACSCSGCASST